MNPSMDVEDLKKRYCGRLQHSLFLSLLLICVFYGAAFLGLVTFVYPHDIWADPVRIFTLSAVLGGLLLLFLCLLPLERSFAHCSWLVSALAWLGLLAALVVCSYGGRAQRTPTDNALFVYLAVFVSHTMLALPLLVACVIAVLTALSQIALEAVLANAHTDNLARQIQFSPSPQKSTSQCARDTGVSSDSIGRILQRVKCKVCLPQLLHSPNEDDPDGRTPCCEWYLKQVENDAHFVSKGMWSLFITGLSEERGVLQETTLTIEPPL
ncbi:hypothetical protein TNCV_3654411 [Trichonephila clavipes]|nr:hypothetical protein TNCV_3654411 [Trichonephila clavipes]